MHRIPYLFLVPAALLMALQPLGQQPHLIEKLQMLVAGTLRRPIDIFDLALHGTLLVLLLWKVIADISGKSNNREPG